MSDAPSFAKSGSFRRRLSPLLPCSPMRDRGKAPTFKLKVGSFPPRDSPGKDVSGCGEEFCRPG